MLKRMAAPARKLPTVDEVIARLEAGEVIELIGGEIVPREMSRPAHGRVQLKAGELLGSFNRKGGGPRGPGGWWLMTEVEVLYSATDEIFRHDVVGFRRDRLGECPSAFPARDRPDWACEVISRSTARHDVVKKQRTLHAAGVPHYWLIDPENETLVVYRNGPDGYVNVLSAQPGETVRAEPFDAIEIDVSELLGRDS